MFFSSFFALFSPPYWRNHNFGRKISKNFAHTQAQCAFFCNKVKFRLFFSSPISFCFPLYATYLPIICHLSPLEPHWNLIGTSLEPRRMMSVFSSSYHRNIILIFSYVYCSECYSGMSIASTKIVLQYDFSCIYQQKALPLQH